MDQSTTAKAKDLIIRISSSPVMGIFHAVNSTFLMALGHFAAQVAIVSAPDMPKLQVVFIRCCEQFLFLIPFILLFDAKVFHSLEKLPTIILISASGYFCYIGLYLILDLIPLSTAIAISGTCPFFASLFSYIILKEKIKVIEISCGIVGLIGVLFIARPTFIFGGTASPGFSSNKTPKQLEILHLIGCGVAVVYGAARALYLVYLRKWRRIITETRGQQVVTVLYPSIFSILITPMIMIAKKDVVKLPAENYGMCVLFIVGLLTSLGLMSLTMATKTQNATVIGVIRNLEIVWAFVLQYFVFGYIPSWWNLGGSVLIVCTTIVASLSSKLNCTEKSEG